MDNVLFLNQLKQNILDFDITLQGLEQKEMFVYFIIQTDQMTVGFKAEKTGIGDKWTVRIPPLPFLERTSYQFYICVICDQYYFESLHGTVTIVGTQDVYITKPENITLKSTIPDLPSTDITPTNIMIAVPTPESAPLKKKWREKTIAELAKEATSGSESSKKPIIINETKATPVESRDAIVKRILEETGGIKGDVRPTVTARPTRKSSPYFTRQKVVVR